MPSSRGSSRLKDRTRAPYVSCIVRQILYHRESQPEEVYESVFLPCYVIIIKEMPKHSVSLLLKAMQKRDAVRKEMKTAKILV